MSKLSCCVIATSIKTAVNYNATRQTGTHADIQQISNMSVLPFAMPDLSKSRATGGVINNYGKAGGFFQQLNYGNVAPWQNDRDQKLAALVINETWQTDANTRKLDKRIVFRAKFSNLLSELVQKYICIGTCFKTNSRHDSIVEIAKSQNRFIRTDIDSEESEAFAVESKRCWRFTADWSCAT